jgi:hypothetical protein
MFALVKGHFYNSGLTWDYAGCVFYASPVSHREAR